MGMRVSQPSADKQAWAAGAGGGWEGEEVGS